MDVHGRCGGTGGDGALDWQRDPDEWTVFVPRIFDGVSWVRIAAPQREARVACLAVAAHLQFTSPGIPQGELEARSASAARMLEDGLASVVMIGERHRVDRIDL